MSVKERIRHLLRAARRVEGEGDSRVAELLRQMAEEALPMDRPKVVPAMACQSDC